MPGVSSLAPRLIKPLCRRGKIEQEAEYLAWRRLHCSQTGQTSMQYTVELEAEYLAWRRLYCSHTGQTSMQYTVELEGEYLAWRRQRGSQLIKPLCRKGRTEAHRLEGQRTDRNPRHKSRLKNTIY